MSGLSSHMLSARFHSVDRVTAQSEDEIRSLDPAQFHFSSFEAEYHDLLTKSFRMRFDEEKFKGCPGFIEIWNRNISIEDLSRRRRLHRFEVINSEFLV
jgi:hypothetical protein